MDDIYDAYGTVEELRIYTELIQRWNLDGVDQLNESLKLQYLALYDLINDLENELAKEHKSYRVWYLKEGIKSTCSAWFKEAQWRDAGYVPPLDEYLSVTTVSTTYPALACVSFVGMGEIATVQAFDWILSFPRCVEAIPIICRLLDNIVSHELEQERDHVATAIQCYVKEHRASSQEACAKYLEMIENAWKELNRECLNQKAISMHLLMRVLNLARVMETMYREYDTYTHSSTTLKDYITLLLVQPIIL